MCIRPTTTEIEEFKLYVASRLDVTEFLDVLGWSIYDLVDNLPNDLFEESFDDLMDACG